MERRDQIGMPWLFVVEDRVQRLSMAVVPLIAVGRVISVISSGSFKYLSYLQCKVRINKCFLLVQRLKYFLTENSLPLLQSKYH